MQYKKASRLHNVIIFYMKMDKFSCVCTCIYIKLCCNKRLQSVTANLNKMIGYLQMNIGNTEMKQCYMYSRPVLAVNIKDVFL